MTDRDPTCSPARSGCELRVTLDQEDLASFIRAATPIRVHLSGPDDPERWVELDEPRNFSLVPDVGMKLEAGGKFHFEAARVPLQDYIKRIRVTVRPEIDNDETGIPSLLFHLDLDEADLATFPKLIDEGVTKLVDRALRANQTKMVIPFGSLLAARGALSPRIQPLTAAKLNVERGSMTITEDRMVFAVDLSLELEREGTPGEHPVA